MSSALQLDVPELEEIIAPQLDEVEARLMEVVSNADETINPPTSHLAAAGGKRLRPMLVLLTAQLGDAAAACSQQVHDAAVAVELTHIATLYHDDVMDSAPTRRGVPSAQHLWGNNRAILAGDILFARASLLVASLGPEMVAHHARTFERLCEGQLNETFGPTDGADRVDFYLQVLADKTGSLVSTAASFGALLSGAGQLMADVVSDFGEKVGVAFQIADDVLDLASSGEQSGKTPGTDLREGVDTLPVLLLRRREAAGTIDEAGVRILRELTGDLSSDEALASVVEQLRHHDVLDETRELARTWADDAVAVLAPLPKGEAKTALEAFANLMVDRLV